VPGGESLLEQYGLRGKLGAKRTTFEKYGNEVGKANKAACNTKPDHKRMKLWIHELTEREGQAARAACTNLDAW
jgi:hypothetical protein